MAEDAARGLVAWDGGARAAAVAVCITLTAGAAQGVRDVSSMGTFAATDAAAVCEDADTGAEQRKGGESAEITMAEDAALGVDRQVPSMIQAL